MHRPLIALVIPCLLAAGCCELGSGFLIKQDHQTSSVRDLSIELSADVEVVAGPAGFLRIETDDNLIDHIQVRDQDGELAIHLDDSCCIEPTALRVTIAAADLRSISIDGSADIDLNTNLAGESLALKIDGSGTISSRSALSYEKISIDIDGSGEIDAELDSSELRTNIDGSADLFLVGRTQLHHSCVDGSANINAFGLASDTTELSVDGSANVEVSVAQALAVDIDGSASIRYCGSPTIDRKIDGSGSIEAASSGLCDR